MMAALKSWWILSLLILFAERWVWVLHGGAEQLLRGRDQVARHRVPPREANHLWRRGGSSPVCEADLPKYSHPLRGAETTTNLVSVVIYLLFYLWRCWLSNSVKPIKWDQSRSMTKANIHFQNFDWNRFVLLHENIESTKIGERENVNMPPPLHGFICIISECEPRVLRGFFDRGSMKDHQDWSVDTRMYTWRENLKYCFTFHKCQLPFLQVLSLCHWQLKA